MINTHTSNNPFGQWCACGKPMEFKCSESIPDNYFTGMTVETACNIRSKYLSEVTDNGNSLKPIILSDTNATIFNGKYTITIKYSNTDNNLCVYNNYRKYTINFPNENDVLTSNQLQKLNALDWDGFKSTLSGYYETDILINLNNDLGDWLIRMFITEKSNGEDRLQIEANGKTYLFDINENSIIKTHDNICNSWEDMNKGNVQVHSFEITLPNGKSEEIILQI